METFFKFLGLAGMALMLGGAWIRWDLAWRQSDIEEDEKDGKISKEVARRRIRLVTLLPTLLIGLGIVMVLVAAIKLLL
jgi:hypothetical protein